MCPTATVCNGDTGGWLCWRLACAAHFVLKHWLMADYLAYYLLLGNYQVHGHHKVKFSAVRVCICMFLLRRHTGALPCCGG